MRNVANDARQHICSDYRPTGMWIEGRSFSRAREQTVVGTLPGLFSDYVRFDMPVWLTSTTSEIKVNTYRLFRSTTDRRPTMPR